MPDDRPLPVPPNDLLSFIDSLPEGPRAFATWEEYERHLRDERNSWDRKLDEENDEPCPTTNR